MSRTAEVSIVPNLNLSLEDDIRLIARGDSSASLTCTAFEAPYEAGRFSLSGLCKDVSYTLQFSDASVLIQGDTLVPAGTEDHHTVLELWPAPAGDSVAHLSSEGAITVFSQYTDVHRVRTDDSEQLEVRYPRHKPNASSQIEEGGYLVLAGERLQERLEILPLIESTEPIGFEGYIIQPHWFAGIRFESEAEYALVEAALDETKVTDVVSSTGRKVRYIQHDALSVGNYALMGPEDRRMYVISFGPQDTALTASN
jgi:hypothetical protein